LKDGDQTDQCYDLKCAPFLYNIRMRTAHCKYFEGQCCLYKAKYRQYAQSTRYYSKKS